MVRRRSQCTYLEKSHNFFVSQTLKFMASQILKFTACDWTKISYEKLCLFLLLTL